MSRRRPADPATTFEDAQRVATQIAVEVQSERLVDVILDKHAAGATRAELARVAQRVLDESNGRMREDVEWITRRWLDERAPVALQ